MQSTLHIIIGLYLLMLPVIGIIGRRMSQERTLRDFYLAGGGLPALPLFFTLYATQYSGNTLFGFAGNAYREGTVIFFAALGGSLKYVSRYAKHFSAEQFWRTNFRRTFFARIFFLMEKWKFFITLICLLAKANPYV